MLFTLKPGNRPRNDFECLEGEWVSNFLNERVDVLGKLGISLNLYCGKGFLKSVSEFQALRLLIVLACYCEKNLQSILSLIAQLRKHI